jgi:hypothetical protein
VRKQPWDNVLKQAKIIALKQITIADNPRSKFVITKDLRKGKLVVSLRKGGTK